MAPSVTASDGDMEGTPMALVDMAATGMPIISTTHSDIPEIIRHGETEFLAEERDWRGCWSICAGMPGILTSGNGYARRTPARRNGI